MGGAHVHPGSPSEYFATNCYVGRVAVHPAQIPLDQLVGKDAEQQPLPGFHIGADNAMFGVDYPHFESIFPHADGRSRRAGRAPERDRRDARKILFDNAADVYGFDRDVSSLTSSGSASSSTSPRAERCVVRTHCTGYTTEPDAQTSRMHKRAGCTNEEER